MLCIEVKISIFEPFGEDPHLLGANCVTSHLTERLFAALADKMGVMFDTRQPGTTEHEFAKPILNELLY